MGRIDLPFNVTARVPKHRPRGDKKTVRIASLEEEVKSLQRLNDIMSNTVDNLYKSNRDADARMTERILVLRSYLHKIYEGEHDNKCRGGEDCTCWISLSREGLAKDAELWQIHGQLTITAAKQQQSVPTMPPVYGVFGPSSAQP